MAIPKPNYNPPFNVTRASHAVLTVKDLAKPDYGDAVPLAAGELPVFWACGVTPQAAIAAARPPFAITHAPGYMLVTDLKNAQLAV